MQIYGIYCLIDLLVKSNISCFFIFFNNFNSFVEFVDDFIKLILAFITNPSLQRKPITAFVFYNT